MQCHGLSTAIRSFRLPAFHRTLTPKPTRNASRFTFPTRLVAQSRLLVSAALANAAKQATRRIETETSPKLSQAALARAASQTIRMCAKEKQFGDALYVLNSMRFSIYPPGSNPPPPPNERAAFAWVPKPGGSQLLSSSPSSINGYTFINFGQPVPTRLASHSFLHSLVRAGLPTKAAAQATLMMADGVRIHTRTMESILASTVDKSPYPPIQPPMAPLGKAKVCTLNGYPVTDRHTRIAVRLLEEARRRRQERTHRMYDVVINACLIQGEIIVASLLFIIAIKDWQLREALEHQRAINPPPEPSEPLSTSPLLPIWRTRLSLFERINHTLTTRKDPQDPLFQNAIQALANLAFAVDTGQFPRRYMGSLIKAFYSVPRSHTVVYIGSPPAIHPVDAHEYIHQVLMRLVIDAGGKRGEQRGPTAGQKFNMQAYNALLHYCLRHRLSKVHASDLLEVMEENWGGTNAPSANILLRSSTLLRDDTIRMNMGRSAHTADSATVLPPTTCRIELPLTRWAHIVNVLKLELALQYPSEPVIHTPAVPDCYTVIDLISHLTATTGGHIIAKKLTEVIPELGLVHDHGSRLSIEKRGRYAVSYGPYFFTAVLNALVKSGRTHYVKLVWRLAREAEKASRVDGNEPWFLPIHAYTCMVQSSSKEGRVRRTTASLRRNRNLGITGRGRRRPDTGFVSAMATGKRVFQAVQVRCRRLEAAKERGHSLSLVPPALRGFAPDERYFNALLDLYGRRALGYARPMKSSVGYWKWLERVAGNRFARNGVTTVHWHPMLAKIVAEMRKYGYEVPEGLRFILVGRVSGVGTGDSGPLEPVRPGPLPLPRRNPHRIPVLKTRGLPIPHRKGKPRRWVRRGV